MSSCVEELDYIIFIPLSYETIVVLEFYAGYTAAAAGQNTLSFNSIL